MRNLSFDVDAVIEGRARLSDAQALELYAHRSLPDLGEWANAVTQRLHPEDYRTYVIDRNINYTNVCTAKCTFCAFRRDHEDADSYTLSFEKIGEKIRELVAINGTQILMQGGMNDRLPIEWYEDLLRFIKGTNFPKIHIHAFSPAGICGVRAVFRHGRSRHHPPVQGGRAWRRSPAAGGRSLTPASANGSASANAPATTGCASCGSPHEEGMNTSATMLIGHIEFLRDRVSHMAAIRDLQDYSSAIDGPKFE